MYEIYAALLKVRGPGDIVFIYKIKRVWLEYQKKKRID
jgi:hypothetical protein